MTDFETLHPRATDGTFAEKPRSAPEAALLEEADTPTSLSAEADAPTSLSAEADTPTFTWFGHWDEDELVLEYAVAGDIEDDRPDFDEEGYQAFAASGTGATAQLAMLAVLGEYAPDQHEAAVNATALPEGNHDWQLALQETEDEELFMPTVLGYRPNGERDGRVTFEYTDTAVVIPMAAEPVTIEEAAERYPEFDDSSWREGEASTVLELRNTVRTFGGITPLTHQERA